MHVPAIGTNSILGRLPELARQWADEPLIIFFCQYSAHRAPQCANWYRNAADAKQRVAILAGGFRGWEAVGLPCKALAEGEKAKAIEGEKAAVGGIGGKFAPAAREGAAKGNYTWKQESEEVEVSVPMPKGTTKSNVKVTILAESIKVEADDKVVLEGTLAGKCSTSGSTWTMAGSRVEITLVKAESTQWPALFEA